MTTLPAATLLPQMSRPAANPAHHPYRTLLLEHLPSLYWLIGGAVLLIQLTISLIIGVISGGGTRISEQLAHLDTTIILILAISLYISAVLRFSTQFPLLLAAGVTRRFLLGSFFLACTVWTAGSALVLIALKLVLPTPAPGDGVGLDWHYVLTLVLLLLAVQLGGALTSLGFIRFHWLAGLLCLALACIAPLTSIISSLVLHNTILSGVGPAAPGFWFSYAQLAPALGGVAVGVQALALSTLFPRASTLRPAAS